MRIPLGFEEPVAIAWSPYPLCCLATISVCTDQCQPKSPEGNHPPSFYISWLLSPVDMAHKGHFQHRRLVWALRLILAWIFLVARGGSHPLQARSWGQPGLTAKVSPGQLQLAGEDSFSLIPNAQKPDLDLSCKRT